MRRSHREEEDVSKEAPRAASCGSVSLQRGKIFPVASEKKKTQCQAKKTGKIEEKVARMQPGAKENGRKNAGIVVSAFPPLCMFSRQSDS